MHSALTRRTFSALSAPIRRRTVRQHHQFLHQQQKNGPSNHHSPAVNGVRGVASAKTTAAQAGAVADDRYLNNRCRGSRGSRGEYVVRNSEVGGRRGLHNQAAASDKEPEEVVVYSSSKTKKTVDKSALLDARRGRFAMDRPFPGLPPLKPPGALKRPETLTTVLPNGLRVASQETYGALCSCGLIIDAGSRLETAANTGVCHLLQLMAFKSTEKLSHQEVVSGFEEMGAMTSTHGSREQMLFAVDVLRDNLEPAMELFAESLNNARITPQEVEEQKAVMQFLVQEMSPDELLKESLFTTAFAGQPLGRTYWCPPESLPKLNAEMARDFRDRHFTAENMVLAGAGVDHDKLVKLGERLFSGVPSKGAVGSSVAARETASKYIGGEARNVVSVDKEKMTRVAVAFKVGGWHDDMLVATCVLQVLLGGGDSFSAGGPGKGMYSRLYREVLNRHYWAEAAEAFTMIQDETGLLGIAGAAVDKGKAAELMHVFCQQFAKLKTVPVTQEELSRARNMLKCNVLTQLESRLVLFEDIGRQMVTYGARETPEEICAKVDAVTAEDILEVARRALEAPPSISMVGSDLEGMPTHRDVCAWFRLGKPQ